MKDVEARLKRELHSLPVAARRRLMKVGVASRADLEDVLLSQPGGPELVLEFLQIAAQQLLSVLGWSRWPEARGINSSVDFALTGVVPPNSSAVSFAIDRTTPARRAVGDHATLHQRFQPARRQGAIGTCVAHAWVSVIEGQQLNRVDLSEAFLYGRIKSLDGMPETDGSTLKAGLQALLNWGVCREEIWPYLEDRSYLKSEPAADVFEAALEFRPSSARATLLPPRDVELMRDFLSSEQPVAIAVPIFRSLQRSLLFHGQGRFLLRLGEQDDIVGYHALTLVGWLANEWLIKQGVAEQLGGGAFLARNSWGSEWAANSPLNDALQLHGGYALLPFAFVEQYAIEAGTVWMPPVAATLSSRVSQHLQPMRRWWQQVARDVVTASSARLEAGLSRRVTTLNSEDSSR